MKRFISLLFITIFTLIFFKIAISSNDWVLAFQSGDKFKLYYKIVGEDVYFRIEGKTLGYVSIGFEPTQAMKDADMVIGYVVQGNVYAFDAYSTGLYGPHPEDTSLGGKTNIFDIKGEEKSGYTIIEFRRPLDTKDKYDALLKFDKEIKIIWALSNDDNFNARHSDRGSGVIVLKKVDVITQPTQKIVLKLKIGDKTMFVNDSQKVIDVPPLIIEGRTLLPIRWIAEPLGAEVSWDGNEKKVVVLLKETKIELWIGKNIAKVNGKDTQIDPNNPKVVPIIKDGRTLLPVRFVAENLGCSVEWDSKNQIVIITYPK
ncbi:MAG: stalk domain-containing protein [Caldisericia bacterium]|nr:stalk domain-containing protein [Caldisericia bacterium]